MDSTREKLIKSATKLFARHGYDGVSIREIIKDAKASLSAVNYHFGSKEGLYKACLEDFGKNIVYIAERVLKYPHTPYEFITRMEVFVSEMFHAFLQQKDVVRIVQRECDRESDISEELFAETYLRLYELLINYLEQAQKRGVMDTQWDPEIITSLVIGTISEFLRTDRFKTEDTSIQNAVYREKVTEQMTKLVGKIVRGRTETETKTATSSYVREHTSSGSGESSSSDTPSFRKGERPVSWSA